MCKVFKLNPYGICISNKMVNGKQYTLVFYVEDNKVSHMEAKLVEDLFNNLKNHFGELIMTRGKKHKFWGMNINIT